MHQLPRPSPRSASAANNSTNPERTNNPRDRPPQRTRSSMDLASYTERVSSDGASDITRTEVSGASIADRESSKLNQIIQNFHTKAALMICSARASLPKVQTKNGDIKQNRWFNLVLDETDILMDDMAAWKGPNMAAERPPPLVVEVYLDTAQLNQNQVLTVEDEEGNRYDVADMLADSNPEVTKTGGRFYEVVLERWTISLDDAASLSSGKLHDQLPNIYKKGVVLFRSLYTYLRFLPAWKLYRRLGRQSGNHQALKLKFRIRKGSGDLADGQNGALTTPLYPTASTYALSASPRHTQADGQLARHEFPPLICPAGHLRLAVDYRTTQSLSVTYAESHLSSRFVGYDHSIRSQQAPRTTTATAGRSLPGARTSQYHAQGSYGSPPSSINTSRAPRGLIGAYGSLNTFHAPGKRASPITEIRRHIDEFDSSTSPTTVDRRNSPRAEAAELNRPSSSNLRINPPFKAGSAASSPKPDDIKRSSESTSTSPPMNIPKKKMSNPSPNPNFTPPSRLTEGRVPPHVPRRSSPMSALEQLGPNANPSDFAVASSGSSNAFGGGTSAPKYSSSFANRPRRATQTTGSGGSSSTSAQQIPQIPTPRSPAGESGGAASSAAASDDEGIAAFIASLNIADQRRNPTGAQATPKKPFSVSLAKYEGVKDGSAALADEMGMSAQLSSTPASRRLSNVPGLSTSSPPSHGMAQHAPHVRSRLSAHSIAEEGSGGSGSGAGCEEGEDEDDEDEPFMFSMA